MFNKKRTFEKKIRLPIFLIRISITGEITFTKKVIIGPKDNQICDFAELLLRLVCISWNICVAEGVRWVNWWVDAVKSVNLHHFITKFTDFKLTVIAGHLGFFSINVGRHCQKSKLFTFGTWILSWIQLRTRCVTLKSFCKIYTGFWLLFWQKFLRRNDAKNIWEIF